MTQTGAAAPLHVAVIIGSTREGRVGDAVGRWLITEIRRHTGIEPNVIDLVDFEFPDRYPYEATAQMLEFAGRIGAADAFVVVTPEYNRSFPSSLKQAIDSAYDEWHAKPAGIVSYGYRSEGVYAMEHLRTVFGELHVATMRSGVSINLLKDGFDDCDLSQGARHPWRDEFPGPAGPLGRAESPGPAECLRQEVDAMLCQLTWWGLALRDARAARPYVS